MNLNRNQSVHTLNVHNLNIYPAKCQAMFRYFLKNKSLFLMLKDTESCDLIES